MKLDRKKIGISRSTLYNELNCGTVEKMDTNLKNIKNTLHIHILRLKMEQMKNRIHLFAVFP